MSMNHANFTRKSLRQDPYAAWWVRRGLISPETAQEDILPKEQLFAKWFPRVNLVKSAGRKKVAKISTDKSYLWCPGNLILCQFMG